MVAVMITEQATRVEEAAGLPKLDHITIMSARVKFVLVVGTAEMASERVLSVGDCLDELVGFLRHPRTPPA